MIEVIDSLVKRSQIYHLLLADVVKSCEHFSEEVTASKCSNTFKSGFAEILKSGKQSDDLIVEQKRLLALKKASKFAIHFNFSKSMSRFSGRTMTKDNGYLITVGCDVDNIPKDKIEQLTIRFVVAHELAHIILHDASDDVYKYLHTHNQLLDTNPVTRIVRKDPEIEREADEFATKMLMNLKTWNCPVVRGDVFEAAEEDIKSVIELLKNID